MTARWRWWRASAAARSSAGSRPPLSCARRPRSSAAGAEAATRSRRPGGATPSGSTTRFGPHARRSVAPCLHKLTFVRVLAIDHGEARAGAAVCDPSGTIVRPLEVISPPDAAEVMRLAEAEGAEAIVVGLPVSLDGVEREQAAAARGFAAELGELASIPVETYDERLTTRMAERTARSGAGAHPDSIAAAHLLESYLQARGRAVGEG
ncbi:MAG: Holliday junction resolvase RuvX [Solirubrobacterales bacterium]|nr:Holliday junction resolvase RuvX [Solirubrobacterales bacterium]